MCDDLGFSDLACYGGEIRTPNLDRLAADGMRFTQFYNCAVCVTTRAGLLTGLYPRHGSAGLLRNTMATLAEVLRAAGYQTALTGKWHLGSTRPPEDAARYRGKYDRGYFALRRDRHQRQIKLGIVKPSWKLSPIDKKTGSFRYDYDIELWKKTEALDRERRRMEVYAGMVDCLDQGVGRLLTALKDAGVEKNTLVLFLSDNGGCATISSDQAGQKAYNRDLPGAGNTYDFCGPGWGWAQCTPFRRYKTWTYEGGIATPMIARWPGVIRPGSITRQVGHVIDFMPTLLELADAEYPKTIKGKAILPYEGKSLAPIFRTGKREGHDSLCWYLMGNRTIRQGKWKLAWGASDRRWELYDMEADRTETNDLAADLPRQTQRLANLWEVWAKKIEVPRGD